MTNTVHVAATMLSTGADACVEQACRRLNFTYHPQASSAELLSSVDTIAPQILVLQMIGDAQRTLRLQKHFRNARNPLCVVFLDSGADVAAAVQAMKLGAIDVLSVDSALTKLADALRLAHQTWQIRSDWIKCRDHACAQLRSLSERQLCVLRHVAQGMTNRDIATELQISARTVEKHRQGIYERTATHHPAELTRLQILAASRSDIVYKLSPDTQDIAESSVKARRMAFSAP